MGRTFSNQVRYGEWEKKAADYLKSKTGKSVATILNEIIKEGLRQKLSVEEQALIESFLGEKNE